MHEPDVHSSGLYVRLLGPVSVEVNGQSRPVPGRLDRAVLAHLALAEGRAVSVDTLMDALWPDNPPAKARNALQAKLSRLRGVFDPFGPLLQHAQGSYRLLLHPEQTDVSEFRNLLRQAEELLHAGQHTDAAGLLHDALSLHRGEPLAELDPHPRIVAARTQLNELVLTAREAHAEARTADRATLPAAIADLRGILEEEPLRSRARLALMTSLDRVGRRAEALAAYDAGRRMWAHDAGLDPPAELRRAFEDLLRRERAATRDVQLAGKAHQRGPMALLEATQWVAERGDIDIALQLALRGAWWWWIGGQRNSARDTLEDLLERSAEPGPGTGSAVLSVRVWAGVYGSIGAHADRAIGEAEAALGRLERLTWSGHDALAAVLIAERLYERGEHRRAAALSTLAGRHFAHHGDRWGVAFTDLVRARGALLAGQVLAAEARTNNRLGEFFSMHDQAGQLAGLDLLGYCAEVRGDLVASTQLHTRALQIAREAGSPDWEATQLTRLGNVGVLARQPNAIAHLDSAADISAAVGAEAVTALCRNGTGVALFMHGDREGALVAHSEAYGWYERTNSLAGLAYTGARRAMALGGDDVTTADSWASASLRAAVGTGDPRAMAHSLEALALVDAELTDAVRALAAASSLREASAAPLPASQSHHLQRRRQALRQRLGKEFDASWRAGAENPIGTASAW